MAVGPWVLCACVLSAGSAAATATCGSVRSNDFCRDVTWNASLPRSAAELDAAAHARVEQVASRLRANGDAAGASLCIDAWKALHCATSFPKCASHAGQPPRKVCRTLCARVANACNSSDADLRACHEESVYDEPPCTDYATDELTPGAPPRAAPSPAESLQTAAGLPVLLGLAAVVLHAILCLVQCMCGGGTAVDSDAAPGAREALKKLIATHEMRPASGGGEL